MGSTPTSSLPSHAVSTLGDVHGAARCRYQGITRAGAERGRSPATTSRSHCGRSSPSSSRSEWTSTSSCSTPHLDGGLRGAPAPPGTKRLGCTSGRGSSQHAKSCDPRDGRRAEYGGPSHDVHDGGADRPPGRPGRVPPRNPRFREARTDRPGHRPYNGPMYFGHGSWVVLVVFGAMFAMRALSSQRRRGGSRGAPASRSAFTGTRPRGSAGGPASGSPAPGDTTFTGIAPGWLTDPFCRHEQRYWSGSEWTEHVTDGGVPGADPPTPR